MARRKHDRTELTLEFLQEKRKNHRLTLKQFSEERGLSRRYMSRLIGTHIVAAWDRVNREAQAVGEKKIAQELGATLAEMAKANQAVMVQGLQQILPSKEAPVPVLGPKTFADALAAVKVGGQAYRDTLRVLRGDKPVLVGDQGDDPIFEVVQPTEAERKKARRVGNRKGSRDSHRSGRHGNGRVLQAIKD